jgi:quinol monooxygenase YgiN
MNAFPDTVIELRQYTLVPGARDRFIDRFEAHFLESQAAAGAHVLGHFRDLDRPDHFVWLRGFADLQARTAALTDFYQSPVWLAHRQAANAELIDNDDVLLLKPVDPAGLTSGSGPSLIVLVIAALDPGEDPAPL